MAHGGKEKPKLKIPYYPDGEDKGHYEVNTLEEKIVREYTGYCFSEIEELNVIDYWLLLRDAVVYNCLQTKEGREYLENCWRLDQTGADRLGLRAHFSHN